MTPDQRGNLVAGVVTARLVELGKPMSRRQLASESKVSFETWRDLLTTGRIPRPDSQDRLCKYLEWPPNALDLLGRGLEPPEPAHPSARQSLDRLKARQEELDRRSAERRVADEAAGRAPDFTDRAIARAKDAYEFDLAAGRERLRSRQGNDLYGVLAFQSHFGVTTGEPDMVATAITVLAERVAALEARLNESDLALAARSGVPAPPHPEAEELALAAEGGKTTAADQKPAAEAIKKARARKAQ